jgi:hypothetical protein
VKHPSAKVRAGAAALAAAVWIALPCAAQEVPDPQVADSDQSAAAEQDFEIIENMDMLEHLDLFKEQDIDVDMLRHLELFLANS